MAEFDDELDATGLNCPLPILRAKKALNGLEAGKVLRIIATDPGSVKDFEAFAKQTGNELMSSTEEDGKILFLMRTGGYGDSCQLAKKTPVLCRVFFLPAPGVPVYLKRQLTCAPKISTAESYLPETVWKPVKPTG